MSVPAQIEKCPTLSISIFRITFEHQGVIGSYVLAGASPRTGFEIEAATQREIVVRDYPALGCEEMTVLYAGWSRL